MKRGTINKKIVAIVAVVALIAILGICLVACNNKDSYVSRLEKAGYEVEILTGEDIGFAGYDIEWVVTGVKGDENSDSAENVTVIKFKKAEDAKDFVSKFRGKLGSSNRTGSVLILGTDQGRKDAQ